MNLRFSLPLIALAAALPAPVLAQSVQDFQLPPAPTPTSTPEVQGPVDAEAGVPLRPRAIPTATPAPTPTPTPTPTAAATPAPSITPEPVLEASPQPRATPASPVVRQTPGSRPQATSAPAPQPTAAPIETTPIQPPVAVPTGAPQRAEPLPETQTEEPSPGADGAVENWLLYLGLGLLALLGALGVFFWRRRSTTASAPEIERPVVAPSGARQAGPVAQDLRLQAEAVKLTRSFANATLRYRLTVLNRSDRAISGLSIGADLVSAHAQASMEEQVALPETALEKRHEIARIAPGQSQRIEGQVQLPLAQAQVIRQGRMALFVPLLRVRLDGGSIEPVTRTFVIGQGVPDAGRLQPFRLDEPPRSYEPIAQRAID